MTRLRGRGVKRLFLEVEEGNEAGARVFIAPSARVPWARRPRYYEHGADAAIFSLAL